MAHHTIPYPTLPYHTLHISGLLYLETPMYFLFGSDLFSHWGFLYPTQEGTTQESPGILAPLIFGNTHIPGTINHITYTLHPIVSLHIYIHHIRAPDFWKLPCGYSTLLSQSQELSDDPVSLRGGSRAVPGSHRAKRPPSSDRRSPGALRSRNIRVPYGCFHNLGGSFCGCAYKKSPTTLGSILGPLICLKLPYS